MGDTAPGAGLPIVRVPFDSSQKETIPVGAQGVDLGLMRGPVPGALHLCPWCSEGLSHLTCCLNGGLCLIPGQQRHLKARRWVLTRCPPVPRTGKAGRQAGWRGSAGCLHPFPYRCLGTCRQASPLPPYPEPFSGTWPGVSLTGMINWDALGWPELASAIPSPAASRAQRSAGAVGVSGPGTRLEGGRQPVGKAPGGLCAPGRCWVLD